MYYSILGRGDVERLKEGVALPNVLWTKSEEKLLSADPAKVEKGFGGEDVFLVSIEPPETLKLHRYFIDSSDPRWIKKPIPRSSVRSIEDFSFARLDLGEDSIT